MGSPRLGEVPLRFLWICRKCHAGGPLLRGVGGGEVLLLGAIDDGGERVIEEGDQDGAGLARIALEDRLSEGNDEGADDIPVERVLRMLAEPTDLRPEAVDDDGARGVALDAR